MEQAINIEFIELEPDHYHILLEASFPGTDNLWWLIDTGASKSVIDITRSELFSIEQEKEFSAKGISQHQFETAVGRIENLQLDGTNFGSWLMAVINLQHINDEFAKTTSKRIIGLLGGDFLMRHKAVIDYHKGTITVDTPH